MSVYSDSGCKDLAVKVGDTVTISNSPRKEYGQQGVVEKTEAPSKLYHLPYLTIRFGDGHKDHFCTCELQ